MAALGQRWRHMDRSYWVWLLAFVVLAVLVINPLARLLIVSFQDGNTGAFTLANYVSAYGRTRHLDALLLEDREDGPIGGVVQDRRLGHVPHAPDFGAARQRVRHVEGEPGEERQGRPGERDRERQDRDRCARMRDRGRPDAPRGAADDGSGAL